MATTFDVLPLHALIGRYRVEIQARLILGDVDLDGAREPWRSAEPGSLYLKQSERPSLWQKKSDVIWESFIDGWDFSQQVLDDHLDVEAPAPSSGMRLAFDAERSLWVPMRSASVLGIVMFHYRFATSTDAIPSAGHVQMDNADPVLVSMLYVHQVDLDDEDIGIFLGSLRAGHWINIIDRDDADRYYNFDVIGTPVDVGGIYHIPVSFYEQAGAPLGNNNRSILMLRFSPPDDVSSYLSLSDRITELESLINQVI